MTRRITARPSLATVAAELGVSAATVSNVFNRPDRVSAELRERVLAVAERHGAVALGQTLTTRVDHERDMSVPRIRTPEQLGEQQLRSGLIDRCPPALRRIRVWRSITTGTRVPPMLDFRRGSCGCCVKRARSTL